MKRLLLFAAFVALAVIGRATNVALGYSNGQVSQQGTHQVTGKTNVSAAVYIIPEVYEKYSKCDITGIRVGLASAKYYDSLTVWVRETLDGEDILTKRIRRADGEMAIQGWNDVFFDTPKPLDGKSFFIGFTYHQRYKDSAVSVVGDPIPNTSYFKGGANAQWTDISNEGVISLELLVGGENMPPYDLKVNSSIGSQTAEGVLTIVTSLTNNGTKDATEYDLTFTGEGYQYVQTVANPIASSFSSEVTSILYDVPAGVGFSSPLTVTVTRIAGGDDSTPEDNSAVVALRLNRNVVVEEFTGTGCGWCPRGLVGMDKLHEKYGERFVGIAIHSFNQSDPMYPNAYKNIGLNSAPSCKIDRVKVTDPYYGDKEDICDDFESEMNQGSFVAVNAQATFNENRTEVDIVADVTTMTNLSNASVAFVLTADSLTGTTKSWKQTNFYYQYAASQLPDDLAQFGNGGANGGSSFFWVFNDVAIATYYQNGKYEMSLGNVGAFETKQVTTTVSMPTKAVLVEALRYDLIVATVFVLDDQGHVVNAVKTTVKEATGVKELDARPTSDLREVARYTLDGRMVTTPQKGINIVRLSDGTTKKVLVK